MVDTIVYDGLDSDSTFDALSANKNSYKTIQKGPRNLHKGQRILFIT